MRSNRNAVVIAAVVGLCLAGICAIYFSVTENSRHVSSLIDMTYEYTELDLAPNKLGYNKQTWNSCGDLEGKDKAWMGAQASDRFQLTEDASVGAEPLATRLEDEGWTVQRYYSSVSADERARGQRHVHAQKGNSTIYAYFSATQVSTSANSGPCVSVFGFPDPPVQTSAEAVDVFPE